MAFELFGGLALFLYSMEIMGNSLQKAAGKNMQKILKALTSVPIVGVLVGAVVTSVIQSSSATTVMTVGFVNAGLLNLKQAISVIFGANIGTTMTAQLIAFKIDDYIFLFIALGFLYYLLSKKDINKSIGMVFFGFGMLLLGMFLMKSAMEPLQRMPEFTKWLVVFSEQPILGLAVGLAMTMVLQSSSATIGILMAVTSTGLIPIEGAIPILMGDNIGTCITAVLSSIGSTLTGKRAAFAHVIFNIIGATLVMIFLPWFTRAVLLVSPDGDITRQIANAHTLFNVTNTLIFLPFINLYVKFIEKIVPGRLEPPRKGPEFLDRRVLGNSTAAFTLATKEMVRMAKMARNNLELAIESLLEKDNAKLDQVGSTEDIIDDLQEAISLYLVEISHNNDLSEKDSRRNADMLHSVYDLERVGDHAENISEIALTYINSRDSFSDKAIIEMKNMNDLVLKCLDQLISSMENADRKSALASIETEKQIDIMEKQLRDKHTERLNKQKCSPTMGMFFLDTLTNLERVGDHANNVASAILREEYLIQ